MMRRFSAEEEQALLFLLAAPGTCWRPIPVKPGPCMFNRLAQLGCASVLQEGPARRARLTGTGRYFATLLTGARAPRADIFSISGEPQLVVQVAAVD
jgi:hypothetical protein